jgi:hypothetical protein
MQWTCLVQLIISYTQNKLKLEPNYTLLFSLFLIRFSPQPSFYTEMHKPNYTRLFWLRFSFICGVSQDNTFRDIRRGQ